jgi:hypothetical protein
VTHQFNRRQIRLPDLHSAIPLGEIVHKRQVMRLRSLFLIAWEQGRRMRVRLKYDAPTTKVDARLRSPPV